MEQENTNKNPEKKDLLNSSFSRIKKYFNISGKYEKGVFILLISIIVIGVPLSIWGIGKSIRSPFELIKVDNDKQENTNTLSGATSRETTVQIENLRELDTDEDGVNDYDELYRYKTSPYIADSDSDKISDKLEIDQGTDPNCPEGQVCGRDEDTITNGNLNTNTTTGTTDQVSAEDLTVDQLRQIMIDAGAPEDQVMQIPEDDLIETYKSILQEEGISQDSNDALNLNLESEPVNSQGTFNYADLDYETLINLPAADIRTLLIEGGVPQEELAQIDDETLREIYLESLAQNFNETTQ